MKVYWVTAQDPYVDIGGSMNPHSTFGPWQFACDAESASKEISKLEQSGYSKGSRMPAYENIEIIESEVLTTFDPLQIY